MCSAALKTLTAIPRSKLYYRHLESYVWIYGNNASLAVFAPQIFYNLAACRALGSPGFTIAEQAWGELGAVSPLSQTHAWMASRTSNCAGVVGWRLDAQPWQLKTRHGMLSMFRRVFVPQGSVPRLSQLILKQAKYSKNFDNPNVWCTACSRL